MGDVTIETKAYAKFILHAAKYPHCAVNGILLADGSKLKDGSKNQELEIVDAIPLFHHSHYVSPMAEVALTQIDAMAQSENLVIAGYYAACENFRDNTPDKCPGQRIAEKIAEMFPAAVFIVKLDDELISGDTKHVLHAVVRSIFKHYMGQWKSIDNKRFTKELQTPAIKLYKWSDGKWKTKDANNVLFQNSYFLKTVSDLVQRGVCRDLVDFDNYLDDQNQDWSNLGIEKVVASLDASYSIDYSEKNYD